MIQIATKTRNLDQIRCFWGQIFKNTPNFANRAHWVWKENTRIDASIAQKCHTKQTKQKKTKPDFFIKSSSNKYYQPLVAGLLFTIWLILADFLNFGWFLLKLSPPHPVQVNIRTFFLSSKFAHNLFCDFSRHYLKHNFGCEVYDPKWWLSVPPYNIWCSLWARM